MFLDLSQNPSARGLGLGQHHAFLLLCPKLSSDQGLPPSVFRLLAQELAGIQLAEVKESDGDEGENGFWTSAGAHVDVFIADRDRAILRLEDIESIRKLALYPPTLAQRRLFFLDRCERMNVNAANSLLKVLEEPPANAVFLLTARGLRDVLPTVASRCQKVQVRLPGGETQVNHLEPGDAEWLAKQFNGWLREGHSFKSSSSAFLRLVTERSEALAKLYDAETLRTAIVGELGRILTHHPGLAPQVRLVMGEIKAWKTAQPFNPSSQLWLTRIFLRACRSDWVQPHG